MTGNGYKRTLWRRALNFRFTPDSRHSNRHFRFRIVFVCFWGATSTGRCNTSVKSFRRRFERKRFAWPLV
jgi:hypothetical protein